MELGIGAAIDHADKDYLNEVQAAYQKCCRAVIVRLDDDASFDRLLAGPLAKDLDAYDQGRISSREYVQRIYQILEAKNLTTSIDKANRAFRDALDNAGPVLHYLHIQKNWDKSKNVEFRSVDGLIG